MEETEAIEYVMKKERELGRTIEDVSSKKLGYDLISRGGNDEIFIEVKGRERLLERRFCFMTKNEYEYFKKYPDKTYLYLVYRIDNQITFKKFSGMDVINNSKMDVSVGIRYRFRVPKDVSL